MSEEFAPVETREIQDPWTAAMRRGDFAEAWRISDAHLRAAIASGSPAQVGQRHVQRVWNGEPLAGRRVLVRCYHGLGDTVQFIRFAAPLRRQAREVIVWAQSPLLSTVASADGVDRVLPLHDGTPDAAFDADIEIMELAHALQVDAHAVQVPVPYIHRQRDIPRRQGHHCRPRVGIVWRAGNWDLNRSVPVQQLVPLADALGSRLFSLQRGPAAADAAIIDAMDVGSDDVDQTVEVLRSLDLVMTVDTFIVHLAGALGIPVWLLLARQCDWRWGSEADRTLWYPTMRLFRQQDANDWRPIIEKVIETLPRRFTKSGNLRSEQTYASDVRPE